MLDHVKNILDYFDEYFPYGNVILDEIRRTKVDLKTFLLSSRNNITDIPVSQWLTIEVTNICNSNCIFCPYRYQDKFRVKKGFMSDEVFEKVIKEFKQLGGKNIGLTPFSGEPLLDEKIMNKIKIIKREGLWTGFFTNGIMLNHINVAELLETGIDGITISTAPFDSTMYELIYQNKNYSSVLQGLKKLLAYRNDFRKTMPIGIAFRSHIPRRRVLALPDFRETIMPLLIKDDWERLIVNTRGIDSWGGIIKSDDMVGMMRLALIPRLKNIPCAWLSNLYVTWEGHVRACPCRYTMSENSDGKDDLYLGDIRDSTLADILNGDGLKQLRMRFKENNLPELCKLCTMYKPFAGANTL